MVGTRWLVGQIMVACSVHNGVWKLVSVVRWSGLASELLVLAATVLFDNLRVEVSWPGLGVLHRWPARLVDGRASWLAGVVMAEADGGCQVVGDARHRNHNAG